MSSGLNLQIMNILDVLEYDGEEKFKNRLSVFSCPVNPEIDSFLRLNALNFARRKLTAYARLDADTNSFTASAFLLAQIGKNYDVDNGKRITGSELIGYANDIMTGIQHRIGGGIIYLDCEDRQYLKDFYIDRNHYKIFGERYSNSGNIRYLQMIRFF